MKRNMLKEIIKRVYRETEPIPMWGMWVLLATGIFFCIASIASLITTLFTKSGHSPDWVFALIVSVAITVLVMLAATYVALKTYHWYDEK